MNPAKQSLPLAAMEILGAGAGDDSPLFWSIDRAEGVIQGPLDLGFLSGKQLVLNLEPRQVALLSVDGQLRSAYLDGRHVLSVDAADTDSDGAMLHFVHIESVLQVPWTQHLPVAPAAPGEPTSRLANGVFEVVISDPVRFHRAFLRDGEGQCETDCVEALSHLLPTFLTIHLARVCGAKADMETQRTALKQLDPAHLDAVLTPYGVRCTAIRIHEGFGGLPLVDKAGDLPAEDRCDALPIDCRAC